MHLCAPKKTKLTAKENRNKSPATENNKGSEPTPITRELNVRLAVGEQGANRLEGQEIQQNFVPHLLSIINDEDHINGKLKQDLEVEYHLMELHKILFCLLQFFTLGGS